jgi:Mg2+ and Co2+ transporter CorA
MWHPSLFSNSRWLAGLLLVDSSPRLSTRIERPFDLGIQFGGTESIAQELPVSLMQLEEGQPFAVFDHFRSMLELQGPSILGLEPELETSTRRALTLFSDGKRFNDWDVQRKVEYSMWILAAYQWESNLKYLKAEFTRLRFVALAQPGMRTYLPLIHLRQLIVGMRDRLPESLADSNNCDELIGPDEHLRLSLRPSPLSQILTRIVEDLEKLDKELNDETHLIIGAVTVQDSDANKEQTERATLLTLLAAVYLPLTLVTGIFGMNIKDINDGNPSWRACGEVLAVVAVCTVVFVVAYQSWRRWRKQQRKKERMQFGFDKDV